jgi:hypothetical protein
VKKRPCRDYCSLPYAFVRYMNRLSAALVEFRISSLRIFSSAHEEYTDGCITIPDHDPQCMNEVGRSGQVRANQRGFQLLLRCLYRSASDRTDPTTPLVTDLTRDCSHVFLSLKNINFTIRCHQRFPERSFPDTDSGGGCLSERSYQNGG